MPIQTAICATFKQEDLRGVHVLDADILKMALIKTAPAGTLDGSLTNYSDLGADEVVGTGYTAGGETLTNVTVALDGDKSVVDFDDPEWGPAATISARGCLIYNASKGNAAIAVYDFGDDIGVTNGTFIVRVPEATATTAILRLN